MASLITVRLNKGDSPNWGFRLQGGKDFGTPLVIQKVNGGSPAERAGLVAGDSVIKINNTDVFNLLHKDAQDVIVRSGNNFDMTIQRGGSTWKPSVIPTGSFSKPTPSINNISPVTKTSLAAHKGENIGAIGTGHNLAAKPFSAQNGAVNGAPKLVNKQYNTPLKLYSEDTIAETLSAQTEVLSTGALGVNFKKNEKDYDATNSAVYRMLQEAESEPKSPHINESEPDSGIVTAPNRGIVGLRHVEAPLTRPAPSTPQLPPGQNICAECERLIVGVFVRIKDKNLHVECFKCATCGTSLKNVGYYNINNKLYCDIHAKLAAINNSSASGLLPVTVSPGGKAPASAISSALSSHSLPSSSPLSPKSSSLAAPYQPEESRENVDVPSTSPILPNLSPPSILSNINKISNSSNIYSNTTPRSFSNYLNKPGGAYSGPKPFSSVSAPLSTRGAPISPHSSLSRAPLSPVASAPAPSYSSYSPTTSAGRFSSKSGGGIFKGHCVTNIIWPPPQEEPEVPTACPLFYPPPSYIEAEIKKKAKEKELELETEAGASNFEVEQINNMASGNNQFYPDETCTYTGRRSATECIEILSETLQTQKFIENMVQKTAALDPPSLDTDISKPPITVTATSCAMPLQSCDLSRPTQYTPNTVECQLPNKVENVVPQKWESPLTYVARTVTPDPDTFAQIPTKRSTSTLASALAIAPVAPFNPVGANPLEHVPLPEETEPYFPPDHSVWEEVNNHKMGDKPIKSEVAKEESSFVKALKIAPERPFTPVGGAVSPAPPRKKPKDPTEKFFEDLPKPQSKLDMRSALTTAPDRPYSPLVSESVGSIQAEKLNSKQPQFNIDRSQLSRPVKPEVLPESFQMNQKPPKPPSYYSPSVLYEQTKMHSEESRSENESKQTRSSEITQTMEVPQAPCQATFVENEGQAAPNQCLPLFQGFSCSFQNKTEHSQFSIEISTTPPVPTPPPKPQTPVAYVATAEAKPISYYHKETITEEKQQTQSCHKQMQQVKQETKQTTLVEKQAEEIIKVKPISLSSTLRKPEALPQYQKNLQEAAEADLLLMERKARAQERMEEQKKRQQAAGNVQIKQEHNVQELQKKQPQLRVQQQESQELKQQYQQEQQTRDQNEMQQKLRQEHNLRRQEIQQEQGFRQNNQITDVAHQSKPITTVQSGDTCCFQPPQINFQPVIDDNKPPSGTFSPRPRALTPSMINKAPPVIPYYQSNLVAQFHKPLSANVLDPRSPAVSRSPSPCPERSVSPFPSSREIRPKSPAAGPPPNPLISSGVLPTPENSRKRQAKESLSTFIPEYKAQRDLVEQTNAVGFAKDMTEYENGRPIAHQGCRSSNIQIQSQSSPVVEQSSQYESRSSKNQNNSVTAQQSTYEQQSLRIQDMQQIENVQNLQSVTITNFVEKAHQEQLEALKKTQEESTEVSDDGLTQVQRKLTVTEEFEHCHREKEKEILNRTFSNNKKYPFHNVNLPEIQNPIPPAIHRTDPQRNVLPSHLSKSKQQVTDVVCKKNCNKTSCQNSCEKLLQQQARPQNPTPSAPKPLEPPVLPLTKHVFAPGSLGPVKHVTPPGSSGKPSENVTRPSVPKPDVGVSGGRQTGGISVAPKRGRGVLNTAAIGGTRIPLCGQCHGHIRGPFITALGKIWCPQHFTCSTPSCRRPLQDLGFVEENGQLYCEYCFEQYLAPPCSKCGAKIKGDCLKAIGKQFHPECFNCVYCGKLFGNNPFFLEDGSPYCEADWNELFTTKCFACGFPVEAGDRWVEALNNNYHSQCFNCTMCKKNLEGQSFFAKGGRPFCKNHAR